MPLSAIQMYQFPANTLLETEIWFKRGLRLLLRRAVSALPLPKFFQGAET